jgi:hypothetical protein
MGADEKIRERQGPRSAQTPIGQERLAGKEGGLIRNRLTIEHGSWQGFVEILDMTESNRNLGIDDRVDDKAVSIRCPLNGLSRPSGPMRILRHDVEKHIGVDQDCRHLVFASQRHDGIRAHRDVAPAAQVRDKARAASCLFARLCANDANDFAIELEFHFGMRQQTRPFANVGRNGHLAF